MSEAATLAIIRDLFVLAGIALVMALAVYAALRAGGGPAWNYEGEVLSRPYGWEDGVTAILIISFFVWSSSAQSPAPAAGPSQSDATTTGPLIVGIVFMLMLAGLLLTFLRVRGLNPAELFGMRQMTVKDSLFTAVGWLMLVYVLMVLTHYLIEKKLFDGIWPDNSTQDSVKTFQQAGGLSVKLLLAVSAVIIAPIAEEIIFRGYIYGVVKSFSDRWFAAIFSALIFAAVHQHIGSLPALFVLALGLAMAYEATGCLLVPMCMHALFNGYNVAHILAGPP